MADEITSSTCHFWVYCPKTNEYIPPNSEGRCFDGCEDYDGLPDDDNSLGILCKKLTPYDFPPEFDELIEEIKKQGAMK